MLAVLRSRGVERTLAWVFAIIAFPGVGAIAYLMLADPNVRRTRARKRRAASAIRKRLTRDLLRDTKVPEPEASVLNLASALTGMWPTRDNEIELLAESAEAFASIEAAMAGAKRSIYAEYYIIRSDETGQRFLTALADKAREGLDVRLLYDAVGSLGLRADLLDAITKAGGKVAAFLPVNPLKRRWSVHLRNHRKVVVVDGVTGFTGGMNIGDEYSGRGFNALKRPVERPFRDSHLRLVGPAVWDLSVTFAEDWSFATGEQLVELPKPEKGAGSSTIAIVPSGPDQEHNANGLVFFSSVASARRRVWLTSPYFIPDEPTMRALMASALRGVDVRLIVPKEVDVPIVKAAAQSYFPALVGAGVRVYEYTPSMLHAKTLVVDSAFAVVGSANVDIRSFRLNFEVGALVVDRDFAAIMERRFELDLAASEEVTPAAIARRSFTRRLVDGGARLLSPLL